jgi:hypothetical protein
MPLQGDSDDLRKSGEGRRFRRELLIALERRSLGAGAAPTVVPVMGHQLGTQRSNLLFAQYLRNMQQHRAVSCFERKKPAHCAGLMRYSSD